MKIPIIFFAVLFLLSPLFSAVEFNMKETYSQGETLISTFSANFVDAVTKENVRFYRGHVRVSIEPHLTKIGEEYYLYAQLPENPANYSVRLEDVKYMKGSQVVEEDIIKNFTITNQTSDFWVDPGVIVTSGDFDVEMQNLQENKIIINLKIETVSGDEGTYYSSSFGEFNEGDENSFSLISGAKQKLSFKVKDIEEDSLKKIIIYTGNQTYYEIPLYVLATPVSNKKEQNFQFDSKELQIKIPTGEELVKTVAIKNTGQEPLSNIQISFSEELNPYLLIPIKNIEFLDVGEEAEIGLYFSKSLEEKVIEGQLKAQTDSGLYTYSALTLIYLRDYKLSESEIKESVIKTCSDLGGRTCLEGEKCSVEITYAKDGVCCEGSCIKQEKGSFGWLGWILIVLVIGFLIWFFLKYRKIESKPKFPFEKRPGISNKEVPLQPPREVPYRQVSKESEDDKKLEKDALKRLQEFKKKFGKK